MKEKYHYNFLYQNTMPEWWEYIDLKRKILKIKKGNRFIEENEEVEGVYFVEEGLVKIHKHWGESEMIVRFAKEGDIVGHRGISLNNSKSPISATAIQNSIVSFVELSVFKVLLKTNNSLVYKLMKFYAEELQWSEQKAGSLVNLSVKERMKIHLFYLKQQFGCDDEGFVKIELTRADLAAYIGTTYESVYRVILELEKEGKVLFDGKKFKIED